MNQAQKLSSPFMMCSVGTPVVANWWRKEEQLRSIGLLPIDTRMGEPITCVALLHSYKALLRV